MEKPLTKFFWDVDSEETLRIYKDIGVKELDEGRGGKEDNEKQRQSLKRRNTFRTPENQQHPTKKTNSLGNQECTCQLFHTVPETDDIDWFENLTDEIILNILKWLPRQQLAKCACVSKRWKRLCMDEFLWKRADLSERTFLPGTCIPVLSRLGLAAKLAKATILGPLFGPSSKSSKTRPKRQLMLQYLDLTMCNAYPADLETILSMCTCLKKLSLESCKVTKAMLQHIARQTNLEELNLCMLEGIEGTGLNAIIECTRLKSFNLGWSHLNHNSISHLINGLPSTLERLCLSGCRESLQDRDVELLATRCKNLIELDLSDGCKLTGNIFADLETLPNLQHLALSRCYRINNPAQLVECLKRFKRIQAVELFGLVTEQDLKFMCSVLVPIKINTHPFSSIARPDISVNKKKYIWEINCRI